MKIVLVDDLAYRAERIIAALTSDYRFASGAICHRTLSEAYVGIEQAQPDLVIISAKLAGSEDYSMFDALLKMLRTAHIVIGQVDARDSEISAKWANDAHVDAFLDRLDGYLNGGRARPKLRVHSGKIGAPPVLIGSSTGGVEALEAILKDFPADCPPTLIVQHIKPQFLGSMVRRLDRVCAPSVVEASHNSPVQRGVIAIAPGGPRHLEFAGRDRMVLVDGPPQSGHRPSVDRLFASAVRFAPATVAVILTGMGRDGATGLAKLRSAGAWTIAQDAETSVVHGMPNSAVSAGGVCEELPLDRIAKAILKAHARLGDA